MLWKSAVWAYRLHHRQSIQWVQFRLRWVIRVISHQIDMQVRWSCEMMTKEEGKLHKFLHIDRLPLDQLTIFLLPLGKKWQKSISHLWVLINKHWLDKLGAFLESHLAGQGWPLLKRWWWHYHSLSVHKYALGQCCLLLFALKCTYFKFDQGVFVPNRFQDFRVFPIIIIKYTIHICILVHVRLWKAFLLKMTTYYVTKYL